MHNGKTCQYSGSQLVNPRDRLGNFFVRIFFHSTCRCYFFFLPSFSCCSYCFPWYPPANRNPLSYNVRRTHLLSGIIFQLVGYTTASIWTFYGFSPFAWNANEIDGLLLHRQQYKRLLFCIPLTLCGPVKVFLALIRFLNGNMNTILEWMLSLLLLFFSFGFVCFVNHVIGSKRRKISERGNTNMNRKKRKQKQFILFWSKTCAYLMFIGLIIMWPAMIFMIVYFACIAIKQHEWIRNRVNI